MICLDQQTWFEIAEAMLDDSAGEIDEPPFKVEQDGLLFCLIFDDPKQETLFRLRWIN